MKKNFCIIGVIQKKQKFILLFLLALLGIFALIVVGVGVIQAPYIYTKRSIWRVLWGILCLLVIFSLYLVRMRTLSNLITIILLFIIALFSSIRWGASVPIALLFFGMTIGYSGLLFSSRLSLFFSFAAVVSLISVQLLQQSAVIATINVWKNEPTQISDIVLYSIILCIYGFSSWSANRKKELYLSEIIIERNKLEEKVMERTKLLQLEYKSFQEEQKSKYLDIQRLASLGKIASGIIHNIASPVTYSTIIMEQIRDKNNSNREIAIALSGIQEIAQIIKGFKKQFQKSSNKTVFIIENEIALSLEFLQFEIQQRHLSIDFDKEKHTCIYGDSTKFHQCISNLISNAIESFDMMPKEKRRKRNVYIAVFNTKHNIRITVRDNGCGIPEKDKKKIFQPLYTTKKCNGIGIGLSTTKEIIETEFFGRISYLSREKMGTSFVICIPKKEKI